MTVLRRAPKVRLGVVGYGEWGPNHARNFSSLPDVNVVAIVDPRPERLRAARANFPRVRTFRHHHDLLKTRDLDCVVVATPTCSHARIVEDALQAGMHVLCEKPLSSTVDDARRLIEIAEKGGRFLMVGHVFLFNGGILKLRDLINSGELGGIRYLTCRRTNLGPIRSDVNAVWDLASHDVSILNFLLDALPTMVSAVGGVFLQRRLEDVAFLTLTYPNNVLAHIHVSWMDPVKVREITAVGDAKMAIWNDLSSLGPIRIFDRGIIEPREYRDFGEFQLLTREGDVTIPRVVMEEPLKTQARHFVAATRGHGDGLSDGRFGLGVVKVLAAVDRSMARGGAPVPVDA